MMIPGNLLFLQSRKIFSARGVWISGRLFLDSYAFRLANLLHKCTNNTESTGSYIVFHRDRHISYTINHLAAQTTTRKQNKTNLSYCACAIYFLRGFLLCDLRDLLFDLAIKMVKSAMVGGVRWCLCSTFSYSRQWWSEGGLLLIVVVTPLDGGGSKQSKPWANSHVSPFKHDPCILFKYPMFISTRRSSSLFSPLTRICMVSLPNHVQTSSAFDNIPLQDSADKPDISLVPRLLRLVVPSLL